MYIPSHFRNENQDELLSFMKSHPFAVVCSNGNPIPFATHLPFIIRQEEKKIFLISHFAYGNPHAHALKEGSEFLIIFSGPNAYISPALYEKKENVPTWNYIAVHASGTYHLLDSVEAKEKVLLTTIMNFDPDFKKQYDELSPDYISRMLKGIVAFEMEVAKLEGKFKLSQNKTVAEQKKIAASFHSEKELSDYMKDTIQDSSRR